MLINILPVTGSPSFLCNNIDVLDETQAESALSENLQ